MTMARSLSKMANFLRHTRRLRATRFMLTSPRIDTQSPWPLTLRTLRQNFRQPPFKTTRFISPMAKAWYILITRATPPLSQSQQERAMTLSAGRLTKMQPNYPAVLLTARATLLARLQSPATPPFTQFGALEHIFSQSTPRTQRLTA